MDVYIGPAEGTTHSQPTPTVVTTTGSAGHADVDRLQRPGQVEELSLTIGLLATINGTFSTAIAKQTARAYIGHQASVLGVGSVHLENTSNITASADGTGIGAGLGISVGAADVTAILNPTVGAYGVGGGGSITGSDMRFTTKLNYGFAVHRHGVRARARRQRGAPRGRRRGRRPRARLADRHRPGSAPGSTATATGAVTVTVSVVIQRSGRRHLDRRRARRRRRADARRRDRRWLRAARAGLRRRHAVPERLLDGGRGQRHRGAVRQPHRELVVHRHGDRRRDDKREGPCGRRRARRQRRRLGDPRDDDRGRARPDGRPRRERRLDLKMHVTSDAYSEADAFAIALLGAAAIVEITATDSPYVSAYAAPFSQNGNASVITEHNYNGTTPITTNGAHAVTTTVSAALGVAAGVDERARDRGRRRRSRRGRQHERRRAERHADDLRVLAALRGDERDAGRRGALRLQRRRRRGEDRRRRSRLRRRPASVNAANTVMRAEGSDQANGKASQTGISGIGVNGADAYAEDTVTVETLLSARVRARLRRTRRIPPPSTPPSTPTPS